MQNEQRKKPYMYNFCNSPPCFLFFYSSWSGQVQFADTKHIFMHMSAPRNGSEKNAPYTANFASESWIFPRIQWQCLWQNEKTCSFPAKNVVTSSRLAWWVVRPSGNFNTIAVGARYRNPKQIHIQNTCQPNSRLKTNLNNSGMDLTDCGQVCYCCRVDGVVCITHRPHTHEILFKKKKPASRIINSV